MNNTPETDALVSQFLNGGEIPDISAHARKLEQERDKAREHLSAVKHFLVKYIAERDSAWEQEQIHYDNYIAMKKERDEAREAIHDQLKS